MASTATDATRTTRRFSARDAKVAVGVAVVLLLLCEGTSIRSEGQRMEPGLERTVVRAVGEPAGWVAEKLPFAAATDEVTGWFSADDELGARDGGFAAAPAGGAAAGGRVSPAAFDPIAVGDGDGDSPPARALGSLLVTGDSMVQPLDGLLARTLAGRDVRTAREAHLGTGISKSELVDWGLLAREESEEHRSDAVIVFLGANEGFPMRSGTREVECCSPAWAAEYATRVRSMVDTFVRGGATRVYWVTLPAPRDAERRRIAATVNSALRVATAPYGAQVRLIDAEALFTPGGRYRDAISIDGRRRLVRDADGIHLNERGAELLADRVVAQLARDFRLSA